MDNKNINNITLYLNNNKQIMLDKKYLDNFFISNIDADGNEIAYNNDKNGNLVGNFLTLKVHNLFNSTDEFVDSISNHYIEKIEINLFNNSQKTIFFNEKKVIEKGKRKNINKEILVYKNCVCILISKYKMKYIKSFFV